MLRRHKEYTKKIVGKIHKKLDQSNNLIRDETKRKQQGKIPDRTKEKIDTVGMYM
jgi:hypothetical protein